MNSCIFISCHNINTLYLIVPTNVNIYKDNDNIYKDVNIYKDNDNIYKDVNICKHNDNIS